MNYSNVDIAKYFLKRNHIKMKIKLLCQTYEPWGDKRYHRTYEWYNVYYVSFTHNGESFLIKYFISKYDIAKGIEPNTYDILMYLQKIITNAETYKKYCECFKLKDSYDTLHKYYEHEKEREKLMRVLYDCMDELLKFPNFLNFT